MIDTNDVTPEQYLDPRTIRCPECGDLWEDHGMKHACSPRVWPAPSVEAEARRITFEVLDQIGATTTGAVLILTGKLFSILQREAEAKQQLEEKESENSRLRHVAYGSGLPEHDDGRPDLLTEAEAKLALYRTAVGVAVNRLEKLEKAEAEVARLRERLDQFEAYGMPNVAVALDRSEKAEAALAGAWREKHRDEAVLGWAGVDRLSLLEGLLGDVLALGPERREGIPASLWERIRAALGKTE